MILVPLATPGVKVVRAIGVFGFYGVPDRASAVTFTNVRVPASNMLVGEGRGFEIAQGRLGPGRIHHCMRLIGLAERMLELMCKRSLTRVAFGKTIAQQGVTIERIAEIAMIKVAVPNMACKVIDWAIQLHGGGGTNNDLGIASAYATARLLRLADGPDEPTGQCPVTPGHIGPPSGLRRVPGRSRTENPHGVLRWCYRSDSEK
jgi:acyl-CoA dehydrogenase